MTNISLTIKILHLRQGSFTRKVRTIFTLKIIVSIFFSMQQSVAFTSNYHITQTNQDNSFNFRFQNWERSTIEKTTCKHGESSSFLLFISLR
jgi:uncharacterized membrane protein